MKTYEFVGSCADQTGEQVDLLRAMCASSVETTYSAMLRNCDLISWSVSRGYETHPSRGLTLKQDWHVGYYRSTFEGKPCYFLRWSAFEFIWVKRNYLPKGENEVKKYLGQQDFARDMNHFSEALTELKKAVNLASENDIRDLENRERLGAMFASMKANLISMAESVDEVREKLGGIK